MEGSKPIRLEYETIPTIPLKFNLVIHVRTNHICTMPYTVMYVLCLCILLSHRSILKRNVDDNTFVQLYQSIFNIVGVHKPSPKSMVAKFKCGIQISTLAANNIQNSRVDFKKTF